MLSLAFWTRQQARLCTIKLTLEVKKRMPVAGHHKRLAFIILGVWGWYTMKAENIKKRDGREKTITS